MPREKREKILEQLKSILKKNGNIQYTRMLNRKEILEISKYHEIGVHSYSHESMGYESNDFFQEDFNKCQDYFKNILKLPLKIYAFPNGSYKKEQLDYLSNKGIQSILLVNNTYSKMDTNIHNRFTFYSDSLSETELRAVGFYR
jgi:peptidoglycan/xylan/chitin deacetylase (PgdA/CDA1 family)